MPLLFFNQVPHLRLWLIKRKASLARSNNRFDILSFSGEVDADEFNAKVEVEAVDSMLGSPRTASLGAASR
ncbi:hypothetical protein V6N12_023950 [Hibiscus sabdariffa]|uniref:Uncharacterized protein n=1 Tax=Hibiscus sabdariffa TaxID=183260 RepID=A0ABR2FZ51_9ROSI